MSSTCPACHVPKPEDSDCPRCGDPSGAAPTRLRSEAETPPLRPWTDLRSKPVQPPPTPPVLPGLTMIDLLGQGGMGQVWRARQIDLDREVAVKILPQDLAQDPEFVERFRREAKALAALDHPNVVRVHQAGIASGCLYVVMERIEGSPLRKRIAEKRPIAETLRLMIQIAEAVAYAHAQGVIHRDIKPENVLIDRDGRAHLADFGLAKLTRPGTARLTHPQALMGTPHYMAPEQVEHAGEVDARADVYSLGVLFYELLTRGLPIGRFRPPSAFAGVPAEMDEIVLRALEKDPARRFASVDEMLPKLRVAVGDPAVIDPPIVSRFVRRHRASIGLALLAAIASGVWGAMGWMGSFDRDLHVDTVWSVPLDSPVLDLVAMGGKIYAVKAGGVDELDPATGKTRSSWSGRVTKGVVPADGRLVIWGGRELIVLRTQRGVLELDREVPLTGESNAPPVVSAGVAYASTSEGRAFAIRLETGEWLWECSDKSRPLDSSPAVFQDRLCFGAGKDRRYVDRARGIWSKGDLPEGEGRWSLSCPPVALSNGWLFFERNPAGDDRAVAQNPEGKLLGVTSFGTAGRSDAERVIATASWGVTAGDSTLCVFRIDGAPVISTMWLHEPVRGWCGDAKGVVWAITSATLWRIDLATGERASASPGVPAGEIVMASVGDLCVAADKSGGTVTVWRRKGP